jgi:hypothetical protein
MTDYTKIVHDDLIAYAEKTRTSVAGVDVGSNAVIETYLDALENAEPYTQALLVLRGYELCGGTDESIALTAARAMQMAHTFAELSQKGDYLTGLQGMHAAQIMLANMDAAEPLRLKVLSITNRALLLHANGLSSANKDAVSRLDCFVTEAFLNPLHVGMVLAGADCDATDIVTPFTFNAGRAQLAREPSKAAAYRKAALDHVAAMQDFWPKADLSPITGLLVPEL